LLGLDEVGVLAEVIGEHVGCGPGGHSIRDLAPVVVPAGLRDLDGDVLLRGVEVLRTLLIGGQLVRVPQPVVDDALFAARPAAACCEGEGRSSEEHRCSECLLHDVLPFGHHLVPLNPMELTIRLPKMAKRIRTGRADTSVAAMRPDQSGAPCGDCDLKTPSPTVSTRVLSSDATRSGQKYSFHCVMNVSSASVASGAAAFGRTIWKKIRQWRAPSSIAASSTSRDMLRKNCRMKKIAKGVMNRNGSTRPVMVLSRPRLRTRRKFGRAVKIGGTSTVARNKPKTLSRPRHLRRENAYAAMELKNTADAVVTVAKIAELRR